jgi:hypothetical protein
MPPVCNTNKVIGLPIKPEIQIIPNNYRDYETELDNDLESTENYVVYFINESTLNQSPLIEIKLKDKVILNAIVDSGSEVNLISQSVYERLMKASITLLELPVENIVIVTAFGKRSNRIRIQVFVEFTMGVDRFESVFMASSQLKNDAIIGCQFFKEYGICIDFWNGSISYVCDGVNKHHEFTTMTGLQSVTSDDCGIVREVILNNTHPTVQRTQYFQADCVDPVPFRAANSCSSPTHLPTRAAGQSCRVTSEGDSKSFFCSESLERTGGDLKGVFP